MFHVENVFLPLIGLFYFTSIPIAGKPCCGQTIKVCECKCKSTCQNTINCPTLPGCEGTWSEWSAWSDCSRLCDGGISTRTRQCSNEGECKGDNTERKPCHPMPCCTEWTKWTECSATCGPGTMTRTKMCPSSNDTKVSPYALKPQNENLPCVGKVYYCPTWSEWEEWLPCVKSVCGVGHRNRTRSCKPIGIGCPGLSSETEECKPDPCPTWDEWCPWSSCSASCGTGTRTRNRSCSKPGRCTGVAEEKLECDGPKCSEWCPWEEWGSCSKECGGGTRTRRRSCKIDEEFCVGSNANQQICRCEGKIEECEKCNSFQCATFEKWADWAACSATCGGGIQIRARMCKIDSTLCVGEKKNTPVCTCQDDASGATQCAKEKCPELGPWSDWATCSTPCGGGTQERKRPCLTDTTYCTVANANDSLCKCGDKLTDSQVCNNQTCAAWGEWAAWSTCSVSCGQGSQTRKRECQFDKTTCVVDKLKTVACSCDGNKTEINSCAKGECYTWSSWSQWSECTVLCGGGSRNRSRSCPFEDGCPGLNDQTDICNQLPCPEWGDWSPWSDCTLTCGGGQRARTRSCPIPNTCVPGEDYETDSTCSLDQCPTWSDWTAWGTCSKTCGQGNRQRTRKCTLLDGCLGSTENTEPCFDKPCTLSTEWSKWSPCTQTCGGGTKIRSKVKCPAGPPSCPIEQESNKCEEQACPMWSEWGEWASCSKTCGGGQRIRDRKCPITNGCVGTTSDVDPLPCNSFGCNTT